MFQEYESGLQCEDKVFHTHEGLCKQLILVVQMMDMVNPFCGVQVIDKVIHKYEEGHDGSEVFQEYENGLQALLSAYSSGSPADHFQLPEQDPSKLVQVISNWEYGVLAYNLEPGRHAVLMPLCQP